MLPFIKFFDFIIYTYPLLMGIAWGVSFHIMQNELSLLNIKVKHLRSFFIAILIISWIGAKLFYFTSTQGISKEDYIYSSNFWLGGGFVFYGGLISGLCFLFLYQLKKRESISFYNSLVPALCIGHAIGRIGCFLAGCCYGRVSNMFFTVHMHGEDRIPVQLIESLFLLIMGIIFHKRIHDRYLILLYLGTYSVVRFFLEFLRGDKIRGIWIYDLSSSQIIALGIGVLTISIYFTRMLLINKSFKEEV